MSAVLWILWAYTPDWVLHSLGITYYPDRYWAIALPMYALSLVAYCIIIYNAWNLCNTNPFESYYTIRGEPSARTADVSPCLCRGPCLIALSDGSYGSKQTAPICLLRARTATCRNLRQHTQYHLPRTFPSRRYAADPVIGVTYSSARPRYHVPRVTSAVWQRQLVAGQPSFIL